MCAGLIYPRKCSPSHMWTGPGSPPPARPPARLPPRRLCRGGGAAGRGRGTAIMSSAPPCLESEVRVGVGAPCDPLIRVRACPRGAPYRVVAAASSRRSPPERWRWRDSVRGVEGLCARPLCPGRTLNLERALPSCPPLSDLLQRGKVAAAYGAVLLQHGCVWADMGPSLSRWRTQATELLALYVLSRAV